MTDNTLPLKSLSIHLFIFMRQRTVVGQFIYTYGAGTQKCLVHYLNVYNVQSNTRHYSKCANIIAHFSIAVLKVTAIA